MSSQASVLSPQASLPPAPKQIRFVNNEGQPPPKRRRINAAYAHEFTFFGSGLLFWVFRSLPKLIYPRHVYLQSANCFRILDVGHVGNERQDVMARNHDVRPARIMGTIVLGTQKGQREGGNPVAKGSVGMEETTLKLTRKRDHQFAPHTYSMDITHSLMGRQKWLELDFHPLAVLLSSNQPRERRTREAVWGSNTEIPLLFQMKNEVHKVCRFLHELNNGIDLGTDRPSPLIMESHRVPYFRYFGPTAIVPGFKQMVVSVREHRRSTGATSAIPSMYCHTSTCNPNCEQCLLDQVSAKHRRRRGPSHDQRLICQYMTKRIPYLSID
jgi:hypothetical protein